jgi:hypothetical protein
MRADPRVTFFVTSGGLISYGPDTIEPYRRAAVLVAVVDHLELAAVNRDARRVSPPGSCAASRATRGEELLRRR